MKRVMAEGSIAKLLNDENVHSDLGYGEARKMVRKIHVDIAARMPQHNGCHP